MTKYLRTREDLKKNIGKNIRYEENFFPYPNIKRAGKIFYVKKIDLFIAEPRKAVLCDAIGMSENFTNIELIEEDNQEQDNKKTVNIKELSDELDEMIKNNKPMGLADNINHPSHYQGKIECIDYLQDKLTAEEFKGFLKGNILKYLSRAGKKDNELEDYKKAKWYLEKLINNKEK